MSRRETIKEKRSWLKNFFAHRQHPIMILSYTTKYMWLLAIPLAKYLIAAKFNFQSWFQAHWVDILTITFIFGYAFLRWIFVYYELEEDCIIAHTGYFGITRTKVYFAEISSLSLSQGYISRLIHSCAVYIDTDAKSLQNADIMLTLTKKRAFELYHFATAKCKNKPKYVYNSKKSLLVIFSLIFSSTLSGMIIVLSVLYEAYRIVGREAEEQILRRVNTEIAKVPVLAEVPEYILIAGGVLAGGWLISFLSNLMRHWNFSCTRCADLFIIRSGIGTRRRHVLYRDRVNYIDLRQSLLMKICKITSVSAHCTGYGKRRLEISALIPITTNGQVDRSLKMLMPKIPPVKSDISTGKADLGRFITIPLICTFIPIVSGRGALYFFPNWKREITILVILTTIPLLWLVIVKAAAAFTTSIGFENGYCTLSYCKWYSFHKSIAALDRVSMVTVMQNPFQKISHTCAVRFYTNSESTDYHAVKGLNYEKVIKLLNRNGYAV